MELVNLILINFPLIGAWIPIISEILYSFESSRNNVKNILQILNDLYWIKQVCKKIQITPSAQKDADKVWKFIEFNHQ